MNEVVDKFKKKDNSRNANIELLRILMMMQIIFLHVSDYGDFSDIAAQLKGRVELTYWVIWLMCRCPVYIFIIIMGYFLSETRTDFNYKRLLKCYLPMYFYSVSIPIVVGLVRPGAVTKEQYITAFFPFLSRTWYFMTLYLLVLILSPYLNKMIRSLNRKEFLILLLICFGIFSVWQPLSALEPFEGIIGIKKIFFTHGGKSLYDFIYMYFLGAFMRRYHIFKNHENDNKNIWNNPITYLSGFLILGLINVIIVYKYPDDGIESVIGYNDNPLVVLQCTCLFRFFEKMDFSRWKKLSKVINSISAGNLGIYMIHEHPMIRSFIWNEVFNIQNTAFYSQKWYLVRILFIIVTIYAVCWAIDFLRRVPGMIIKSKKQ